MKERVLELIEELVGAHTLGQKRSKADEIAALVKTAVFVADQFEAEDKPAAETVTLGPVSGELNSGTLHLVPQVSTQNELQQIPGDPAAENSALSVLGNESPLIPGEDHENHHD